MAYPYRKMGRSNTKYSNKKIEFDGYKFDSIKEKERYRTLKSLLELGVISDLRLQQEFELIPRQKNPETGETIRALTYKADFVYMDTETGETIVEDVKGYRNPADPAYRIFTMKKKALYYLQGIWIKEI